MSGLRRFSMIREEFLPKSPAARAVRYALNQPRKALHLPLTESESAA